MADNEMFVWVVFCEYGEDIYKIYRTRELARRVWEDLNRAENRVGETHKFYYVRWVVTG